jgi:ATP-binding cassette, subfamily B, bacterial
MTHFLRRILGIYLRPYRKKSTLLFLCLLLTIAFDTIFPLGIKFLIDLAIIPRDARMLVLLVSGLVILYVTSSLGDLAADYLTASISTRVLNDLRLKMFSRLQDLPAGYFVRLKSGDLLNRFNNDMSTLEYALAYSVVPGIHYVLQLLINIVVLFLLNVPLALVTLILLPLTIILPKRFADRATLLMDQRKMDEADLTTSVQEQVQAQAVNRIFGLKDSALAAFTHQVNHYASTAIKASFTEWMVYRSTNMGQYLTQLLVIAIGAVLVFQGKLSVGSLVGYVSLLASVGGAISEVSTAYAGMIPAVVSLKRVEELLDEEVQTDEHPNVPLSPLSREIVFKQVTFSYAGPEGKPVLDKVSISIPSGRSVAFVGRSGSGKSTVLNLLMRFYDPDQGQILIDGQDIHAAGLASLRSQMGVVFQDTFLFNTSLRENIRMGKLDASDREVEEAARAAGIHDLILSLPAGYETLAGEQGKVLSGGQRQRIALARAILRKPAILLLDEATSALDPETEALIYVTLKTLASECACTIVSVTHRLAPVADMDMIVVMDQGRVAEQGTHSILIKQPGIYHALFTQQSGFKVSSDGQFADVTPSHLRLIPLFSKLDQADLEKMANQFVPRHFDSGETVFSEGDPGDKFYIVVRGKVSVTRAGPDQQPVQLNVLQDGDYFGEIALIEDVRRTATLRTLQPSLFLCLERKHFENMLASFPTIREAVERAAKSRRLPSEDG